MAYEYLSGPHNNNRIASGYDREFFEYRISFPVLSMTYMRSFEHKIFVCFAVVGGFDFCSKPAITRF